MGDPLPQLKTDDISPTKVSESTKFFPGNYSLLNKHKYQLVIRFMGVSTRFFYKQPGCLALTRKIYPKVKQLAKQPLRVKFKNILQRVEK